MYSASNRSQRMNKVRRLLSAWLLKQLVVVYVVAANPAIGQTTYEAIYNMERPKYTDEQPPKIRLDAIKEVAYQLAVQTAVKERYGEIITVLENNIDVLDTLTDFKPLMLDAYVMPPVIATTDGAVKLIDQTQVVQTDASYKIIKTSRMVLRPPTWRDYLLRVNTPIEQPHSAVLPETSEEKRIWQAETKRGWNDGIQHANRLFKYRWNRLLTEYIGMINYHVLATQQMVTDPNVANANHPIIVSQDGKEMEINKQQWLITKPTGFTDPNQWKVIVSQHQKQHTTQDQMTIKILD